MTRFIIMFLDYMDGVITRAVLDSCQIQISDTSDCVLYRWH